jgi:hypothetical protein
MGSNGGGIGSGPAIMGQSTLENVTIVNSNITAVGVGAYAIVPPSNASGISQVTNVQFKGNVSIVLESTESAAIYPEESFLTDCAIHAMTNTSIVFPHDPTMSGFMDLVFLYTEASEAAAEGITAAAAIEIGNISFPEPGVWDVVMSADGWNKLMKVDSSTIHRLFLTVDEWDNYSGSATQGGWTGELATSSGVTTFSVESSRLFVHDVHIVGVPPTPLARPSPNATYSQSLIATSPHSPNPTSSQTPAPTRGQSALPTSSQSSAATSLFSLSQTLLPPASQGPDPTSSQSPIPLSSPITSPTQVPAPSETPFLSTSSGESGGPSSMVTSEKGLPTGAIVGICVGGATLIGVVAFVVYCSSARRRKLGGELDGSLLKQDWSIGDLDQPLDQFG